jgi:hypothetical protein
VDNKVRAHIKRERRNEGREEGREGRKNEGRREEGQGRRGYKYKIRSLERGIIIFSVDYRSTLANWVKQALADHHGFRKTR